jgi:hypothetical protein
MTKPKKPKPRKAREGWVCLNHRYYEQLPEPYIACILWDGSCNIIRVREVLPRATAKKGKR